MNYFIKNLTPSQQVGLLFVFVFGLLMLATVITVIRTFRFAQADKNVSPHDDDAVRAHPLYALLKTSWLIAIIFWLSWSMGDKVATILFALLSFFALREFMTLSPTKRGDHRSLLLAFFVVLPVQYGLVMTEHFNLFTVFIPVYVFLAIPVVSALSNDPERFLERNAKMQWGIMVCIFGLSHVPALLLLDFPASGGERNFQGKNMFLLFHLVMVVQLCMVVQHMSWRWLKARGQGKAVAPNVSASFNWTSWMIGVCVASFVGGLLAGITPFQYPAQALALSFVACVAGSLGHFVMKALKRDRGVTHWAGGTRSVTGAQGLLDRIDSLCFAAPVFFHTVHWYFDL
jgi:phosphatidate cytidylyltransferase